MTEVVSESVLYNLSYQILCKRLNKPEYATKMLETGNNSISIDLSDMAGEDIRLNVSPRSPFSEERTDGNDFLEIDVSLRGERGPRLAFAANLKRIVSDTETAIMSLENNANLVASYRTCIDAARPVLGEIISMVRDEALRRASICDIIEKGRIDIAGENNMVESISDIADFFEHNYGFLRSDPTYKGRLMTEPLDIFHEKGSLKKYNVFHYNLITFTTNGSNNAFGEETVLDFHLEAMARLLQEVFSGWAAQQNSLIQKIDNYSKARNKANILLDAKKLCVSLAAYCNNLLAGNAYHELQDKAARDISDAPKISFDEHNSSIRFHDFGGDPVVPVILCDKDSNALVNTQSASGKESLAEHLMGGMLFRKSKESMRRPGSLHTFEGQPVNAIITGDNWTPVGVFKVLYDLTSSATSSLMKAITSLAGVSSYGGDEQEKKRDGCFHACQTIDTPFGGLIIEAEIDVSRHFDVVRGAASKDNTLYSESFSFNGRRITLKMSGPAADLIATLYLGEKIENDFIQKDPQTSALSFVVRNDTSLGLAARNPSASQSLFLRMLEGILAAKCIRERDASGTTHRGPLCLDVYKETGSLFNGIADIINRKAHETANQLSATGKELKDVNKKSGLGNVLNGFIEAFSDGFYKDATGRMGGLNKQKLSPNEPGMLWEFSLGGERIALEARTKASKKPNDQSLFLVSSAKGGKKVEDRFLTEDICFLKWEIEEDIYVLAYRSCPEGISKKRAKVFRSFLLESGLSPAFLQAATDNLRALCLEKQSLRERGTEGILNQIKEDFPAECMEIYLDDGLAPGI